MDKIKKLAMARVRNQTRARETFRQARLHETDGAADVAIKLYQKAIIQDPLLSDAYNRLMIIYRRKKDYKRELGIIKQGITSYEKQLRDNLQDWSEKNQKSARLSRALAKSLDLLSDKGIPKYEDRQVSIWKKRMVLVKKKLLS